MFRTDVIEKIKTHFLFSIKVSRKSCCFLDNVEKNRVEPGRPQMTIWRMRIEFWLPKATNTHSEYVLLFDFPLQHWWHEFS